MFSGKLGSETQTQWEEVAVSKYEGNPSLKNFIEFVQNKCQVLESMLENMVKHKDRGDWMGRSRQKLWFILLEKGLIIN